MISKINFKIIFLIKIKLSLFNIKINYFCIQINRFLKKFIIKVFYIKNRIIFYNELSFFYIKKLIFFYLSIPIDL
jgi:hypothetical protein